MAKETKNSLIQLPSADLVRPDKGTNPILARMTQDVLAHAQGKKLSQERFRIGDYLLREPDYHQILLWAEALGVAPKALLSEFAETKLGTNLSMPFKPMEFAIEDGAIVSLPWKSDHLPLDLVTWVQGLRIRELGLKGKWTGVTRVLSAVLPDLEILVCIGLRLISLDLNQAPYLSELCCGFNHLTSLDLSPVPGLKKINCIINHIVELNLSPVPQLTHLYCWGNQLNKLDLTSVPQLTHLYCFDNQINKLDLTSVPRLTVLNCSRNQLTELDLSVPSGLTSLDCKNNRLTVLDLSKASSLVTLRCDAGVQLINPPSHLRIERSQRQ